MLFNGNKNLCKCLEIADVRSRLRDSMKFIKDAGSINQLIQNTKTTHGVYLLVLPDISRRVILCLISVTAFSGLLAPYWDPSAGAMIIGE